MPTAVTSTLHRWWTRMAPTVGPLVLRGNTFAGRGYHLAEMAPARVSGYCVYRRKNAGVVREFMTGWPTGTAMHLHALDSVADEVRIETRSCGPGARMPLLQKLIDAHPPRRGDIVAIFDDDVVFVGGGAARIAGLMTTGEFDIAQPAHVADSNLNYKVTEVVPLMTAREVLYVEVGPVVLFSPRAQTVVPPFPTDARMGWGVDVGWTFLRDKGFRLGVIDAAPVRHLGTVGAAYDNAAEERFQAPYLARAGVASAQELAGNAGPTWRPWARRPRWIQ